MSVARISIFSGLRFFLLLQLAVGQVHSVGEIHNSSWDCNTACRVTSTRNYAEAEQKALEHCLLLQRTWV